MEHAAEIVRALADTASPQAGPYDICALCGAMPEIDDSPHGEDCPWLRARAWIAANPVPDMMQMRDIRPSGTVLAITAYPADSGIPPETYGAYPDGPWERQVRELPSGEWRTVGGRHEDGSYWWTSIA